MTSVPIAAMAEPASILAGALKWGGAILAGSGTYVLAVLEAVPPEVVQTVTPDLKSTVAALLAMMLASWLKKNQEKTTKTYTGSLEVQLIGLANSFREAEDKRETHYERLFRWMGGIEAKVDRHTKVLDRLDGRVDNLEHRPRNTRVGDSNDE